MPVDGFQTESLLTKKAAVVAGAAIDWLSSIFMTLTSVFTNAVAAVVAADLHTNDVLFGVVNFVAIESFVKAAYSGELMATVSLVFAWLSESVQVKLQLVEVLE